MFGNFLYYIIALLIYSTYQPSSEYFFPTYTTILLFFGLILFFFGLTWDVFKKIEKQADRLSLKLIDRKFHSALNRQSIIALFIYAIDIYFLNINNRLSHLQIFNLVPTSEALFFLFVFICYLSIVWTLAYPSYHKIYRADVSKREYVTSNISFSIPVLLPWVFLSVTVDVINLLPFNTLKSYVLSAEGQIIYFMFFLFAIAIFGPLLIQKFWGCRSLEYSWTRHQIDSLCQRTNMKYKDILIWPLFGGHMITAGVMGLVKQFRYILITPALLRHLEPIEIDAVIAHEIGHIKKKHLLFYLFFFIGFLIVFLSAAGPMNYILTYIMFHFIEIDYFGSGHSSLFSINLTVFIILIFIFYFRYIFGFFMRNFERQADVYAYSIMKDSWPLISTFEKITLTSGQSPERPNWHHFSIKERIDFLKKCETDKSWIKKHDSKVNKSMIIYLFAVLLIGYAGYQFSHERAVPPEKYYLDSAYDAYDKKEYDKSVIAYNQALQINPHNTMALNNLAWLYATCNDEKFRNPKFALNFAKRAATLSNELYILDTLAEAYYANGLYKNAVAIQKKVLSRARENRLEYFRHLKKYESALKNLSDVK